jgi:hypothetical protein
MFRYFAALCCSCTGLAASAVSVNELRTGDVLLQPLNCYLCNAIERVEKSIYSHSGIVVRSSDNSIFILESIGGEPVVSLSYFVSRTQKGQKVRALRPQEFVDNPQSASHFVSVFQEDFLPVQFDSDMRWDNRDAMGREPLYCSEFVAKFLERFLKQPYSTKPMRFETDREYWFQFFKGHIPDGEPGIAPSDFLKSPLSLDLGDLDFSQGMLSGER